MLQIYDLECKCGSSMNVQVGNGDVLLRIFCKRCNTMLLEQNPKKQETMNKPATALQPEHNVASEYQQISQKNEPKAASKFAHYTLVKKIGEGAMGKVYLSVDDKTGEKVALKVLRKPGDSKAMDYFVREVQVLRQLDHPNIVGLKGWGNSHGYPYFAMEYIVGNTLEDLLKKGPMQPVYAVQTTTYILDALHYADQFNIIHRDIKPANIIIASNGVVKLIDLGVGKILKQSQSLTRTGQMVGTGYYMPIEQLQDAKRVDQRADIYAVGATLFHTLAGKAPFAEYGKNLKKMFMAKVDDKYVRLGQKCPQLHEKLIEIIEKAMAHKFDKRYANAREMKEKLVHFYKTYLNE